MNYSGYNSNVSIVSNELWSIVEGRYSDELDGIMRCRRYRKRSGLVTKLLRKVILDSSLGSFNGDIYYFGGMIYEPMSFDGFRDMVYELTMERMDLPEEDIGTLKVYINIAVSTVRSKELAVDNSIIVFTNGVLDVKTRVLHKFDRKYVQTSMVSYDYLPGATTFMWYQFLNQVIPNENLQNVLQMFLGAIFVDREDAKIETMLVLLGSGANGKSVIQSAVKSVLGEENVSEIGIGALCASGSRGEQNVAAVNGKRLNYCSEIQTAEFGKDSDRLKAIISGEGVQGRFLYSNGFKAKNIPLLMANANKLPVFKDKSKGMLRRIYVIPMEVEIPEIRQDKSLPLKLRDERSGILNWMLDGRDKFVENGYKLPESIDVFKIITESEEKYIYPLRFMKFCGYKPKIDGVEIAPQNWITTTVLFKRYIRWCEQNGIVETMTVVRFSKILENAGYVKKRQSKGMAFAVFGDITMNTLRTQKEDLRRRLKADAPGSGIMVVDGRNYVTGLKALAAVAGVPVTSITRIAREGKLDECRKKDKEKFVYDVDACIDIFRSEGVIASDAEREAKKVMLKDAKYMRYLFNRRMIYHGLPYRKYVDGSEQIGGYIAVPEDMTEDEAFRMAHEEYGFDLSRVRKAGGRYSRGGIGFLSGSGDEEDDLNHGEE